MTPKKPLTILILILLIVLGWTIWNLIKTENGRPELKDELGASVADSVKPVPPVPAFRKIVSRKVVGPTYDSINNKIKFFEASTGRLFAMSPDGTREQLISETNIPDIKNVSWAPDSQKVIINNYYINYSSNQVLEIDFKNPSWLGNEKVAFICTEGICESNPDGGNKKILLKENIKDIKLSYQGDKLYFYSKPGAEPSPVYSLNPLRKEGFNSNYFYNKIKCSENYCAKPSGKFDLDSWLKGLVNTRDNIYDKNNKLLKTTNLDVVDIIEFEDHILLKDKVSGSLYLLKLD